MLRGRPKGKSEGTAFNTCVSLKGLENIWYAFHIVVVVVCLLLKGKSRAPAGLLPAAALHCARSASLRPKGHSPI